MTELVFPAASAHIKLNCQGLFAFPDQWKTTDDANPGMFTYMIKFATSQINNGKINPRELTQKQLREQEQSKKKGGKKDGKKQENPGDAEKLKQQLEKEEQQQRRKLQEWNKMSEEEQFYSASEDSFKSAILKFDALEGDLELKGKAFIAFQEHVIKEGGEWIYIFKVPTANEEELAKLKKTKPKTLANANDLNPVIMRAWMDLSSLNSSESKQVTLRSKLEQIDIADDSSKPNLQKTYIKINLCLSEALLNQKDKNTSNNMIPDPPEPAAIASDIKCVDELKAEIKIALQSLAMEYSAMFQKQLNTSEELRILQVFVTSRKNQPNRRKQQFLYDFNLSGKYRILKERLKKVIVHLCKHKFTDKMNDTKSFTGVTCSMRDQFYSEIYNFLVNEYSSTMNSLIEEKKQILNEVNVLKQEYQQKQVEEHLQAFIKESREERLQRIIKEYLQTGNAAYGAELYRNQIKKYPDDVTLKYEYSLYCIRNGLKSVKDVMSEGYIDQYMQYHKEDLESRTNYLLLMISSQSEDNLKKAWVVLREIIEQDQNNVQFLLIASLLLELKGQEELSELYFMRASRCQLRKLQKIQVEGNHKQNPQKSEVPSLSSLATYEQQLNDNEKDEIYSLMMSKFSNLGLLNIVEKIKSKLIDQQSLSSKKQNILILFSQQKHEQCQEQGIQLFKETKDIDLFKILIKSFFKTNNLEQCEKYLKMGLKIVPEDQKMFILMKLAYLYLQGDKYGNAKACISKYLQKIKPCGGLSWEILGISELKSLNYQAAIKCFRFSNLSDPFNNNLWLKMAEAFVGLKNFVMVNQCLNSYEKFNGVEQSKEAIEKFLDQIKDLQGNNFYEMSMKEKLIKRSWKEE